jgi:hypothetical protein
MIDAMHADISLLGIERPHSGAARHRICAADAEPDRQLEVKGLAYKRLMAM